MTREIHAVDLSNRERAEAANRFGADITLRIHCNSAETETVEGIELYVRGEGDGTAEYRKRSEDDFQKAESLIQFLCAETGAVSRGVFRSDAWMDSYMIAAGSLHALDNPAWWSPWNPRGEEAPAPVWRTEPPERSMPVYARFDAEGTEICSAAWYDSTLQQYFFKKGGASIDAGCVGWVPLPEEET